MAFFFSLHTSILDNFLCLLKDVHIHLFRCFSLSAIFKWQSAGELRDMGGALFNVISHNKLCVCVSRFGYTTSKTLNFPTISIQYTNTHTPLDNNTHTKKGPMERKKALRATSPLIYLLHGI